MGKIRACSDQSRIKDLQFRVGPVQQINSVQPTRDQKPELKDGPIRLSERQEMTLRAVENDDLRGSIRRAMEAEAARNAHLRHQQL